MQLRNDIMYYRGVCRQQTPPPVKWTGVNRSERIYYNWSELAWKPHLKVRLQILKPMKISQIWGWLIAIFAIDVYCLRKIIRMAKNGDKFFHHFCHNGENREKIDGEDGKKWMAKVAKMAKIVLSFSPFSPRWQDNWWREWLKWQIIDGKNREKNKWRIAMSPQIFRLQWGKVINF